MKKNLVLIMISLFIEIIVMGYSRCSAENANFIDQEGDQITIIKKGLQKIKGLQEPDFWGVDYCTPVEILYQIIRNNQWLEIDKREREEIKDALIDLWKFLEQIDTDKIEGDKGRKWLCQLCYIAGELKESKAIPFLVKESTYIAQESLVKIGEPSVGSVTKALNSDSPWVRKGSIRVLEIWLSGGVLTQEYDTALGTRTVISSPFTPAGYIGSIYDISIQTTQTQKSPLPRIGKIKLNQNQKVQIKDLLIERLNDESPDVREEAIRALSALGDTSVISLLKPIAENDPFYWETDASFRHGKEGEKIIIYPVREEAQRVIKLLEEKKKEEEREKTIRENPSHP